jgi:hypothetical protein
MDYLANYGKHINKVFAGAASSLIYCEGSRAFDWESGAPLSVVPDQYEQILLHFLSHDPGHTSPRGLNVLVLVGGIGTGKSTALRHAWEIFRQNPRKCSRLTTGAAVCHAEPLLVDLDLGAVGTDEAVLDSNSDVDSFWSSVADRLAALLSDRYDFEREVSFWGWCLGHTGVKDRLIPLHIWLTQNEYPIRAALGGHSYLNMDRPRLLDVLARARADLIGAKLATIRDLAWYRVLQLAYILEAAPPTNCSCTYILLDNVDHHSPTVQHAAVDFVVTLSSLMTARAIISIRPYTWQRAVKGQIFSRRRKPLRPVAWRRSHKAS